MHSETQNENETNGKINMEDKKTQFKIDNVNVCYFENKMNIYLLSPSDLSFILYFQALFHQWLRSQNMEFCPLKLVHCHG